ncbi:hypothetical protein CRE_05253 [Caenorhabditis remanei]|uniref:F-box domain-containing protein n=1 Tax=Caenorhabditis remanei TaxID=31234 RepID=E3NID9_CAERE|nr:hypothetical protein CRE_05253 [Caenorhabditis remanei]
MSSPFPLLHLPRLVLCEVFKSLSIGEKILLSLCSRKISIQINMARLYSQKVIVDLDCSKQKIEVRSENSEDTFEISFFQNSGKTLSSNTRQLPFASCTVRVMSIRKGIRTFWKNNQKEGYLSVIRHLLKMFQCRISTYSDCFYSDLFQPTISMLFNLQAEFKMLCICLNRLKNDNLLWNQISSNLGLVEFLRISYIYDTDFKPVFPSWPQKISITSSDWFTLKSLLACTSTTITLVQSPLENKDLDEVLKNWKAGGFPNLKYLMIHSLRSTDDGEHILGMYWRDLDGMTIQNDDGSKNATIQLGPHCIEMSVTSFV